MSDIPMQEFWVARDVDRSGEYLGNSTSNFFFCVFDGLEIVASFHTHPNTGNDYLQEPRENDKRAVRDDPDLKGEDYVGEFVISQAVIYLVSPAGQVREMDDAEAVFRP